MMSDDGRTISENLVSVNKLIQWYTYYTMNIEQTKKIFSEFF